MPTDTGRTAITRVRVDEAVDRDGLCDADPSSMTIGDVNTIVRDAIIPGAGLYTEAVNDQLRRRGIAVQYLAHDLLAELNGKPGGYRGLPRCPP